MAEEDKITNVIVRYKTEGAEQAAQTSKKYNQSLEETSRQYHSLRMAGRELGQISREFTLVGGLFTAGMVADANNYIKTVGQTTQLGAAWIANTNKIKQANLEIGQTTASVMLPAYEKLGDVIEQIANIVQANPWIVSTALTAGGILTAIGTLGFIVSRVMSAVADAGLLLEKITAAQTAINAGGGVGAAEYLPGGAAAGMSALGVTGVALGAAGAALLESQIVDGFRSQVQKWTGGSKIADSVVTVIANILSAGMYSGADNLVKNFIKPSASAPSASGSKAPTLSQDAVNDFIAYQDQIKKTTDTYEQARADTITQYEKQVADTTATYEEQRANEVSNFQRQQQQENARFALQQQEAVQKHNLEMQQLAQNEQSKIYDLAASRDALGLVKEKASYNLQVSQKNAQFALDQQQQQANHNLQMQQNAVNEQARLAEMDKQHKKEMDKLAEQEKDRLQKMDTQYKQQISDYQTAFVDKINAIDAAILGDSRAYTTYLQNEAAQFQSWINNFKTQGTAQKVYAASGGSAGSSVLQSGQGWTNPMTNTQTPYQAGGYLTMAGPGEDGRPEWMASNPTMSTLENMIGTRLTQQNVIAAVAAGRMNGGAAGHMVSIVIQGKGLTVSEVRQISSENLNMKLGELIPSWGA